MYGKVEEVRVEVLEKIENVRKELKQDHKELGGKVDDIAATVNRLVGFHEHEKD